MDIRDYLVLIEGYLSTLEMPEETVSEVLVEACTLPMIEDADRVFVGWIDDLGQEFEDGILVEGVEPGEKVIAVEATAAEFRATWNDTPPPGALEKLGLIIEGFKEFDAYYVGSMIYPLKQQAKIAVNAMARDLRQGY